jgi:predicted transposase YdaD
MLLSRFPEYDREEMLMKFKLHDIRESKIWKEAHNLGIEEGVERNQQKTVRKLVAKGLPHDEIADLLDITVEEVSKLADAKA